MASVIKRFQTAFTTSATIESGATKRWPSSSSRLASGRLLLVNHHCFQDRDNLTAMLSDDDGQSWYGHLHLDGREKVSYPDGVETEAGQIYIIYDRDRYGDREILLARQDDPNLGTILEVATDEGRRWTVAQAYVPEATEGDKRILLVDGEPIGAVLRVPTDGELRNNFHAGGTPAAIEVDDRDRAICSALAPFLQARGQFFVGIDVIGGLLTEINVTSPTGMQEINRLGDLAGDATMEALFWAALESKLGAGGGS